MKKQILAAIISIASLMPGISRASDQIIPLRELQGRYELNFDAVYEINLILDVETIITLPEGYFFTGGLPGSNCSPFKKNKYQVFKRR